MATLPEKVLKNWSSKGKDEALSLFQKAYKHGASASVVGETQEFQRLVYDLVKQAVEGTLESEDVATFFTELSSTLGTGNAFSSLLADILTVLDAEVTCSESKEQRSAFKALTTSCMELVGESLLKERLDMDTLEMVGLVPSKTNFNQKYVKTKTKLFYKQQKFNLFREESEGYAKLVVELGHERRPDLAVPAMLNNIKSLIGRFNLDPNRALDMILEAFECHPDEHDFFLPLLKGYPCEPTTFVNILGFRFQCYQHQEVGKATPTPPSLYQLAAILLREELVKLEELYPHLGLSDTVLKEFHETVMDDAKSKAKKANIVSLTEKTDEERDKEAEVAQEKREYRDKVLSLETNQKLGLCHAFLEIGDWVGAHSLMVLLPPFLPVWSPLIEQSLCQLVQFSLEPLYRSYSPKAAKGTTLTPPSETAKQCSRFEDLYPDVFVMLYHMGPHVQTNPVLLAKIVRLGKVFMKERFGNSNGELRSQAKEDVFQGFISLLDEVVLPSLSLMPCNCGMAEETWSMIKQLPYQIRYQVYGHWKNGSYDLHPELIEARTQTMNRGRYIMKRLTKDNVKPSGRQIGKLSHSNPGIIFDYVLSQIQRYDNFILPVVDSLKYLIPLAYDVLAYCIIEALGNPQKERLKHDDTNVSNWLQGLASFCAHVFKKYPIELTGLLQYITNQLKAGKSFDLLVLKEVVQKMSGIEISEEITAPQLEALAGGELLKAEGAYFSQVRNTKKSSQRLREALIDANLSLPLCLLMAQQRECIIFREGAKRHLKLVGMLYDHCLDTLVQFGGFLSTHLSPEEYNKRIPPLLTLGQDYHIPSDLAFFLLRPGTSYAVSERFLQLEKASKSESDKQDKKSKSSRQEAHYQLACQQVIDPVMENARLLQPQKVWEDISCKLFTTFWVHSLYDLYVPTSRYEDEVGKAKQAMQVLQDDQSMPSSKKKKEQERSTALIEKLQEERQRQEDNHRLVWEWLRQEKDAWFSARVTKNRTITQFLQLCIFPRCRFTASDAIYCAKFVYMLHSLQTPNFSTLLFFDRIFSDISYTVACCTENEVRRYGRFVGALLEIVSRWHASESAYAQECAKTPGFISMMRSSGSGNEKQYLDYENYRHITFKWHFKLTKSLVVLLESKDYMQVRNGLIILTKVLPYYPKVYHLSIALDKRIEKIMEEEKEKRQDLYALAIGYAGMLKNQKQNLVPEAEFHNREERVKHQQSDETKTTAVVKEKDIETPKEDKQTKSSSKPEESKGAATPKVKLEESKSSSSTGKEQVSASGGAKEEKRKEGGGKTEAKASTPSEKGKSVSKERGSEKKGEGKEGGALEQNEQAEQEVSSTAKAATTATKTAGSPLIHNGPVASSPTKAVQRRQHSGDSGSPDERDAKRRKLEDSSRASKEKEQPDHDSDKSLADKKEKTKVSEKKRERSSDKETPEPKRKRESPDATTPKEKESEGKEKKRVMKVSKKENSKTLSETSQTVAKKSVSVKKDKEDKKSHKIRVVKK